MCKLKITQGENMSNRSWFEEPEELITPCDDCPHPNGCMRECVIDTYTHEDVAMVRGEADELR
jgi:hypothetical protein